MKYEMIRVGDTVRYQGVLFEVESKMNGKFGICPLDATDRHTIWVTEDQLKKVLDSKEFSDKYPEE